MASPTSSIPRTPRAEPAARRGGFTLVEILIATVLAVMVLLGVMTTFVFMARTGYVAWNYTALEVEARKALELFSREARMANGVSAYSSSSVTFTIPDSTYDRTATLYSVTYAFNTTNHTFTRTGPPINDPTGTVSTTTLATQVQQIGTTDFIRYFRYVTGGYQSGFTSNTAASPAEIKQVELNFVAQRVQTGAGASTDKVLSARFILRNK